MLCVPWFLSGPRMKSADPRKQKGMPGRDPWSLMLSLRAELKSQFFHVVSGLGGMARFVLVCGAHKKTITYQAR